MSVSHVKFLNFLSDEWQNDLPLKSLWEIKITNLSIIAKSVSNILTSTERVGQPDIWPVVDFIGTQDNEQGLFVAHKVRLPEDSFSAVESTLANNGGLRMAAAAGGRTSYRTLTIDFLETNIDILDHLFRPWIIASSFKGLIEDGDPNTNIKCNLEVNLYGRSISPGAQSTWTLRKQFMFYGVTPTSISSDSLSNSKPDINKLVKTVNFVFKKYTLTSPLAKRVSGTAIGATSDRYITVENIASDTLRAESATENATKALKESFEQIKVESQAEATRIVESKLETLRSVSEERLAKQLVIEQDPAIRKLLKTVLDEKTRGTQPNISSRPEVLANLSDADLQQRLNQEQNSAEKNLLQTEVDRRRQNILTELDTRLQETINSLSTSLPQLPFTNTKSVSLAPLPLPPIVTSRPSNNLITPGYTSKILDDLEYQQSQIPSAIEDIKQMFRDEPILEPSSSADRSTMLNFISKKISRDLENPNLTPEQRLQLEERRTLADIFLADQIETQASTAINKSISKESLPKYDDMMIGILSDLSDQDIKTLYSKTTDPAKIQIYKDELERRANLSSVFPFGKQE